MSDVETVYVSKSRSRSGVFHTDTDCHRFPDPFREWPRDLAEAWDYDECNECNP